MEASASPGRQFIHQYEEGLPDTPAELSRCIKDYARYLIEQSGQGGVPPVSLGPICDRFSLLLSEADLKAGGIGIEGMNVADMGVLLYDASDPAVRQRFTLAHELVESLMQALQGNRYRDAVARYVEGPRKERLCNWGASLILMPPEIFHEHVQIENGPSIKAAERIGRTFQTSRLSTLWHMVYCYPQEVGLILWKHAHKPMDTSPAASTGQLSLLEEETQEVESQRSPRKELRVQWCVFGGAAGKFQVPKHKSISRDSVIFQAYDEGKLHRGRETVDLVNLEGEFEIEAMPFEVGPDAYVASLFHWPDSLLGARQTDAFSGR